ncbi:WxcM-like domain-containing protein [Sphingobacterium siyangense]|uniref:WxcM-like domain-containing protein n=1 Tax=Sphingobacterium siyangense TaxID=459529 RepID=UPI003DA2B343
MMQELKFIQGGCSKDERGQIRFVNDFDMSLVKRFYIIKNADTELVRGWRGHRIEQRWFYVIAGAFNVKIVRINNWEDADNMLPIQNIELNNKDMQVLNVPGGYATAFIASEPNSELLVYADYPLSHATLDDYTWPVEYFKNEL